MKRIFSALFALMCISIAMPVMAQVSITKVDKIAPDDMVWMDMAVEAAKTNVKQGGEASGAVIILNGAFRCQGRANAEGTAESNAFLKSRLNSLKNAKVYTVNEPTTATYVLLSRLGVEEVIFVNGRDAVVKAGLATAEEYTDAFPADVKPAPIKSIEFPEATNLLK